MGRLVEAGMEAQVMWMDERRMKILWGQRALILGLMSLLYLFVGGCSGGEVDLCGDSRCGPGEVCIDGACFGGGSGSCEPGCEAHEVCELGRCVAEGGGCDYRGQACSRRDYGQFFDGYLCMDWEGGGDRAVCSQDCRRQGCPGGEACYLVSVQGVGECSRDDQCLAGQFCYQGSCAFAACQPGQCDFPGGRDARCPQGTRCEIGDGGLNRCVRAGERSPGERCLDALEAEAQGREEEGCVEEAACINGVCRGYCAGEGCDEGQECIATEGGAGNTVQVCAKSCLFGAEESGCDARRETCVPLEGGRGVCEPAGERRAFEECELGGELCEPGTICAAEEGGERYGRCLPICDLSLGEVSASGELSGEAQRARDLSCPQGEAAPGAWTLWHLVDAFGELELYVGDERAPRGRIAPGEMANLGEEGEFARGAAGQIRWALRRVGSAATDLPVIEGAFNLRSGESQILFVVAKPGDDQGALVRREVVEAVGEEEALWFQGVEDLEPVDIWGVRAEETILLVSGLESGEMRAGIGVEGVRQIELRRAGGEEVLYSLPVEGSGSMIALRGTVDPGDLHPVGSPAVVEAGVPDLTRDIALALTCRAVNGGLIGACLEVCEGLEEGRCSGEQMGCGPRYHDERRRWTTVCQPVGDGEAGAACNVAMSASCGEGLYCQAAGGAKSADETGVCSALCEVSGQGGCPEGQGCRPIDGDRDNEIGECRVQCSPDGSYTDRSCPEGRRLCRPEASLIPLGDGINTGYGVEQEQPYCWASGEVAAGEPCGSGQCLPGNECLYGRSRQSDLVSTLLSPYFSGGGAAPICRPICDPFDDLRSDHRCGEGETCLFNHPWSADVGHCAPIVEDRAPGEACAEPGMACGPDSICVIDDGPPTCMRFCQFLGSDASGYAQSSCLSGFECAPFVENIGVCRVLD